MRRKGSGASQCLTPGSEVDLTELGTRKRDRLTLHPVDKPADFT